MNHRRSFGPLRTTGQRPGDARTALGASFIIAALVASMPVPTVSAASSEDDAAAHAMPDAALHALGENGLYTASVTPMETPIPLNRIHEWRVHLESTDGVPVTGATIDISGGMPMHDHGLPTAPRVTEELGDGDYRLEGMKFQMPGHWVVELRVDTPAGVDSVVIELML